MRRPCARLGPAVVAAALLAGAAGISPVALRAPAARATSTPPPTPVNGSPSPFPTALRTPRPSVTPPRLASAAAILEDLDTGQVLFAKNADAPRPVASLTKIMTALLALSHSRPEERVTVSSLAAGQSGSVLGLRVGERITVSELMYALLLQSSNDAAVALAEHAGGTLGRFVEMMNEEAARLGLTRTRFYSASGLDDRGRSSARDLATLTRAAYADPLFEQIAATKFHTVPSPSGKPRRIQNRNILLWLYPGAIGVKTGFTTPSGHCLVATADHDGVRLLAVALGAPGHDAGLDGRNDRGLQCPLTAAAPGSAPQSWRSSGYSVAISMPCSRGVGAPILLHPGSSSRHLPTAPRASRSPPRSGSARRTAPAPSTRASTRW